ncbi:MULTISPECIES: autotransporter domain-containing protein [unclassified Dyella]|uniref:autotransporter outer membrane beta-barrel domain-containing protein n=1 Tax=unclassified Dyella TaxID=2634549 RepID=UPI000C848E49|nr:MULTISPECIES: autotransporter domain-containing protein [unclassified Dyella]MDR3444264.1 autotransporter domain-containing protein [Dyella sp.]PMQ07510.1 Lipase 1 [Dyella sp. AD56]
MPRTRTIAGAIAAALLISSPAFAAKSQFDSVVVFGDSLSDAGNISLATNPAIQPPLEFTTNPGAVTVQNVAGHYGYNLSASLAGGTDYAWGGAGVLTNSPGTPSAVPTITTQVNAYLAGGKFDSKALYSIWGGANDIFYAATAAGAGATAQQLIQQNVTATLGQLAASGQYTQAQIAALTPAITQQVTAQVTQAVLAKAGVSGFMTADQAAGSIAAAAQQEVKLIGQMQAAGAKNILVFNLPNIGLTPSGLEQGASAASSLTSLSLVFNGTLNAGLGQLGKGIVPVDTYSLLNEVIANPTAFGFTNVTNEACGVGSSSVQCGPQGSGLPYTYAPGTNQTYLFADGVHPTTAADVMLGQYVVSILSAPGYASLLAEAPLASIQAQNRAIRKQMLDDGQGSDTRVFANVDYGDQRFDGSSSSPRTKSNNVNLTMGADVRFNDNWSGGVAMNIGQHNADYDGGGGYKLQDVSGLGYLTWHQGGGYVGGYVDFGQDNFSDIERKIQIGSLLRTETAKADGNHVGAGLTGGYWFEINALRTGPFATVEWQTVKVNSFNESSSDSTAMWFGSQQRDSQVSTLGWRLEGQWQAGNTMLKPYAELAWNHDSKADPREVTAGLNGMQGSFALVGFTPDKTWGTGDIGLSAQFNQALSGWLGYSGRFGDSSQKYSSVNLGMKYAF